MADFQFYAGKDRDLLKKRGIQFKEIYALSFRLRIGNQISEVKAGQFKSGIGYYFIAPGKRPRIEDGVMTDDDLLGVAEQYFSAPVK